MEEFESKAKELRQKLGLKKKSETEQQTKERMLKVLSDRDSAFQQIYDFQEQTGIPTQQEIEQDFLKEIEGDE